MTRGSLDIGCNERSKASFKEASRVHPESMTQGSLDIGCNERNVQILS